MPPYIADCYVYLVAIRTLMGTAIQVADVLARRIANGDYMARPIPSERAIASQEGVSYMTARKAVLRLIGDGVLRRGPTGRLVAAGPMGQPALRIACLMPSLPSPDAQLWRLAIDHSLAGGGAAVRSFPYAHWDDQLLRDAIAGCDGAFIHPIGEAIPPAVLALLRRNRVVVVDQDLTDLGLPSIRLHPADAVEQLLEHAAVLGGRRVACLNVQPHDRAIDARIAAWRTWAARSGRGGELVDVPVCSGEPTAQAGLQAVQAAGLRGQSLFATTMAAAIGAMRALERGGQRVGRDVAVCTLNDEGLGAVTMPSVTALAAPDPAPFLARCLRWMSAAEPRPWKGALLMQPRLHAIARRESTGTWG